MKIFLLFISLFISIHSFSQDYLEAIAKSACECSDSIPKAQTSEALKMRFGLCIFQASSPYETELLRDHDIDLSRISEGNYGEQLGMLVAVKMAVGCPELMASLVGDDDRDEEAYEEMYFEARGTVFSIEEEPFVCFTIKDEAGRKQKFYWLSYVDSEMNLETTFQSLLGREVYFEYVVQEVFDPRIKEYRNINILVYLDV